MVLHPPAGLARALAAVVLIALSGGVATATELSEAEKAEAKAIQSLCRGDYLAVCATTAPGQGRGLACLEKNAASLSPACREQLPRARALRDAAAAKKAGG